MNLVPMKVGGGKGFSEVEGGLSGSGNILQCGTGKNATT